MNPVQMLMRYKAWADDLFLAAVSVLPEGELTAARANPFGSLLRTLNHAHCMDCVWQSHLLGREHGLTSRNPAACPALDELAARQRRIDAWYTSYADGASESALSETVEFSFIGGGNGRMSREEILLHVANHTTYHRGHASAILHELGVAQPVTDLPVFIREWKAQA